MKDWQWSLIVAVGIVGMVWGSMAFIAYMFHA